MIEQGLNQPGVVAGYLQGQQIIQVQCAVQIQSCVRLLPDETILATYECDIVWNNWNAWNHLTEGMGKDMQLYFLSLDQDIYENTDNTSST